MYCQQKKKTPLGKGVRGKLGHPRVLNIFVRAHDPLDESIDGDMMSCNNRREYEVDDSFLFFARRLCFSG